MGTGKGSQTTTTQTQPNPQAMLAYQQLLGGAQGVVANNPFQTYGGELVAGVNPQQYGGISNINAYAESAQPTISQAELLAMQGATPISASDIQNYYNPYQQNVIGATEAQFANMNAQQQQQVLGNAALQGALGGDRVGVAQANLAGQQQLSQAPVIAGLESQGFNQAAQLALAAKQQQAQGAYSLGNLGVAGQQAGLTGAGAQVQAGTLEQQTQQQLDAARYNQFLMQQAFPYQQWQWLSGIDTGVGSQMGGTSQTTGPPPSLLAQLGGLGLAGVGVLGGTGGFGPQGYLKTMFSKRGGRVEDPLEAHQAADGVYRVAIQPANVSSDAYAHFPTGDGASAQARGKFVANQSGFDQEERNKGYDGGGAVPALIGQPLYGGVSGIVPQVQLTRGQGAPRPSGVSGTQSGAAQMIADAQKLASAFKGTGSRNNAPSGPLYLSPPPLGQIEPPQDLTGGMEPIRAQGGIVDQLPQHDRIEVPRRAGFGLGSFLPQHRQEGGPTILPDGTVDHGTVYLDPEDVPGQGVTPQALAAQRQADTAGVALTRPGVGAPLPASALPFTDTGGVGVSATPVADRIAQRYGTGVAPVTVQRGLGETVPFSDPRSNLWPSLMAAGFRAMASRSPFPGVALGEAGEAGVGTYLGLGREQRAEAMSQQKINQAADNLALHAESVQKNLALATKRENIAEETLGLHKSQAALAAMAPVKIGTKEDTWGNKVDVYAVKEPGSGTYRVIDPTSGGFAPQSGGFNQPTPTGTAPAAAASPQGASFIPTGATLLPTADEAAKAGLPPGLNPPEPARDDDFLKQLPPGQAATVKGLADYAINPNSLSIKGGHREQLIGLTRQYDPTYDQSMFNAKNRAVTEFFAGGPQSPAGTMTAGNTAILHANDMLEAVNKMRDQPGLVSRLGYGIGEAGIPFVSRMATSATNAALRGTPEGATLSQFETARQRFTEEVTKFYSGSQGAQAERDHALALLNEAKSLPELRAAIQMDARLMKDKVEQMQGRLVSAMGPAAWRRAVMQDPAAVLIYKNSRAALDNIMRGGAPPIGQQTNTPSVPAATTPNVIRYDAQGNRIQ